jgi:hypothetical protein
VKPDRYVRLFDGRELPNRHVAMTPSPSEGRFSVETSAWEWRFSHRSLCALLAVSTYANDCAARFSTASLVALAQIAAPRRGRTGGELLMHISITALVAASQASVSQAVRNVLVC